MKILALILTLTSLNCFAGSGMDLKTFSQALVDKMKDDIHPTPKIVNKKVVIREGRNPASEAYDISKLKIQVNDSSRFVIKAGRPSLNAREVNPNFNHIRSVEFRNFYVNGSDRF